MQTKTFSTEQDWIAASLKLIEGEHIALSGGSTPSPIYEAMKELPNAEYLNIYQVDERYVPSSHALSNQRMIRQTLNPKRPHFINTSLPIDEATESYEATLPKQFDLVILGVGSDGHTASLFPQSDALAEANKKVTHVIKQTAENELDKKRITLTFPPIMSSKCVLVLLRGEQKKHILDDMLHSEKLITDLPAKKLLDHPNLHIHYLTS